MVEIKVLCLGHITYDMTLQMPSYPMENSRLQIEDVIESGGGSTANCACLLSKWQQETYICGVVGYDQYSDKIKKEFTNFKVNTNYLETDYEHHTSISYILLNSLNGSRTIMRKKIDLAALKKSDFGAVNFDAILLDGYENQAALKALKTFPSAISILDAGRNTKEVIDLCSKVKFVICSKEFAEQVTNIQMPKGDTQKIAQVYLDMKKRFPSCEIIITLEDEGAVYSYENHIKIVPALKIALKDSMGAGDIFHGAFAYEYMQTHDVEKAVKFANITAGLSVGNIGVKNSFPTLEEVNKYYAKV